MATGGFTLRESRLDFRPWSRARGTARGRTLPAARTGPGSEIAAYVVEVHDDAVLLARLEAHLPEEHRLIGVPLYGKFLRVLQPDVRRRADVEIQIEKAVVRNLEPQRVGTGVGDDRLDLDRVAEEVDLLVEDSGC